MGAVVAYLSKDGLNKMLGPTADYLGASLKEIAQKRTEAVLKIFQNAEKKLGEKLETPGQVPPKILKIIMDEGSYTDDQLAIEYFGGILASSRTEQGRDDRGARIAKILDSLSTYQIRAHYLVYTIIRKLFKNKRYFFNQDDRQKMKIFIPWQTYFKAMEFEEKEKNNMTSFLNHIFYGLHNEGLIESFTYGQVEHLQAEFPEAKESGLIVTPSALGAELYLWGYGVGDKDLDFIFEDDHFKGMEIMELDTSQAIAITKQE